MASANRSALTRSCFTALLVVGIGFLLIGMFVVPYLPYFQLDAVLNKVELADEEKKLATLAPAQAGNRQRVAHLVGCWALGFRAQCNRFVGQPDHTCGAAHLTTL